jgi:DNA-binding MarR family transcriptional regulator
MARAGDDVKVHNTRNIDVLALALIELTGFLNSPQRDDGLLRAADVTLDRALFPLLVRLGAQGTLSVAALSEQAGRDHSTVSRQLAKLEALGLIERRESPDDRRANMASLTAAGSGIVDAITRARRRLLSEALTGWSEADRTSLAVLNRRFADALIGAAGART